MVHKLPTQMEGEMWLLYLIQYNYMQLRFGNAKYGFNLK